MRTKIFGAIFTRLAWYNLPTASHTPIQLNFKQTITFQIEQSLGIKI